MSKNSTLTYLIKKYSPVKEIGQESILDNELEELLVEMDCEDFSPSDMSIKNILNFAASYEVVDTQSAGLIEMNLN